MLRVLNVETGVFVNNSSSKRHRLAEASNDYLSQIPQGFNTTRLAIVTNDGIFTNVFVKAYCDKYGNLKWFAMDGKPQLLVHFDQDQ